VAYCSRECQQKDWRWHKRVCVEKQKQLKNKKEASLKNPSHSLNETQNEVDHETTKPEDDDSKEKEKLENQDAFLGPGSDVATSTSDVVAHCHKDGVVSIAGQTVSRRFLDATTCSADGLASKHSSGDASGHSTHSSRHSTHSSGYASGPSSGHASRHSSRQGNQRNRQKSTVDDSYTVFLFNCCFLILAGLLFLKLCILPFWKLLCFVWGA
jgi:hypothetical protein